MRSRLRRFLDWLKAGGAEFSRLRVTTTARGGRGVVAAAAFAPGDVLLRVPEPLLLTVDKADVVQLLVVLKVFQQLTLQSLRKLPTWLALAELAYAAVQAVVMRSWFGVQRDGWSSVEKVPELAELLLKPSPARSQGTHEAQGVLIRAAAGTGKTFLLKQLLYTLATRLARADDGGVPLAPCRLEARGQLCRATAIARPGRVRSVARVPRAHAR